MITEKDILQQAKDAEKALEEADAESKKKPLWLIVGIGIALLIILMILPLDYFGKDVNPRNIPSLSDVQVFIPSFEFNKSVRYSERDFLHYLEPSNPTIKKIANKIVVDSCKESKLCHAKALFYFVRDNIEYVSDPPAEYLENAVETLMIGGADCDGQAILLANLLQATGFYSRFVFIPQHSYVQILLPQAPSHYKDNGNWINLDPTCKTCEFGELPRGNKAKQKRYVG